MKFENMRTSQLIDALFELGTRIWEVDERNKEKYKNAIKEIRNEILKRSR